MKKLLSVVLVIALSLSALALAGCGPKTDAVQNDSDAPSINEALESANTDGVDMVDDDDGSIEEEFYQAVNEFHVAVESLTELVNSFTFTTSYNVTYDAPYTGVTAGDIIIITEDLSDINMIDDFEQVVTEAAVTQYTDYTSDEPSQESIDNIRAETDKLNTVINEVDGLWAALQQDKEDLRARAINEPLVSTEFTDGFGYTYKITVGLLGQSASVDVLGSLPGEEKYVVLQKLLFTLTNLSDRDAFVRVNTVIGFSYTDGNGVIDRNRNAGYMPQEVQLEAGGTGGIYCSFEEDSLKISETVEREATLGIDETVAEGSAQAIIDEMLSALRDTHNYKALYIGPMKGEIKIEEINE